jgi:hypothetical protein
MVTKAEIEQIHGHPLQYAFVGWGRGTYIPNTEHMTDNEVRRAVGVENEQPVERYNRCPTCEQWSPCDVRQRESTHLAERPPECGNASQPD